MPRTQELSSKEIRYAVVGLGWIAQQVILPGFKNCPNARLTALITNDHDKATQLSRQYGVPHTFTYEQYDDALASGEFDAVYVALPNSHHKDYTCRAACAGIHVLCEKPMAVTCAECKEMIRVCEQKHVKLMIAYRLHFEPGNLQAIEWLEQGKIGEPKIFNSVFSQQVKDGDIRLRQNLGGGPLRDMGVYPINASRYLFRSEPTEVVGVAAASQDPRFQEVHETETGILRFSGDRLAVFTVSFGLAGTDSFHVIGTEGQLTMKPGFGYEADSKLQITGKLNEEVTIPKHDQFGPEIQYFAECILNNIEPEPSGREGLADVRIVEGLLQSMKTCRPTELAPFEKPDRPTQDQKFEEQPVEPAAIINARAPTRS